MNERDMSSDDRERLDEEPLPGDDLPDEAAEPADETQVRTKYDEGPDAPSAQSTGITGGR